MPAPRDPRRFLPLTPVAFEILLGLADQSRHGYALMQEVERRTGGRLRLRPGTLYRAINRLLHTGLLEEVPVNGDTVRDDARRRYYRLTDLGRRVAAAEAGRLASAVEAARVKNLLSPENA